MGVLDGRVAIVTGATSGIGEKIAEVLVEQSATVIAIGRALRRSRAFLESFIGRHCLGL
jgi:NADP-dependent 3-hydroxy acid dehydrogenase YdfG